MSTGPAAQPILLVEDDETLGNLLALHLRAHGHQVEVAGSTEAAIESLKQGLRPSLVLLDINLPGDTGWGLLRNGALDGAGGPPVIITSATTISSARLAEFNVAGYLPKPFPLETLLSTIERLVDQRKEDETR